MHPFCSKWFTGPAKSGYYGVRVFCGGFGPAVRAAWCALGLIALVAGCDPVAARFRTNEAYMMLSESRSGSELSLRDRNRIKENVKSILEALFGTPDDPKFPVLEGVEAETVVNLNKLQISAGSVNSDIYGAPKGLYREHCAHCHGISGDGRGPTAGFLNPYPRDYRLGVFKFKSTPSTTPPTQDDLHRILVNGIPGTAMPSFRLLGSSELESLEHYVRYLAIRGQTERSLMDLALETFDEDAPANEQMLVDTTDPSRARQQMAEILTLVGEITTSWVEAEAAATPVPAPPADFESPESVAKGRQLFFGLGGCAKCHGDTALGDGTTDDFDDWTKELNPKDLEFTNKLKSAHAIFEPRNIRPRNLRLNLFRGGRRPIDLYWRISNGIAGTPMPKAPAGLESNDIWNLIAYVRSLPYDDLSAPAYQPGFQRDRQ